MKGFRSFAKGIGGAVLRSGDGGLLQFVASRLTRIHLYFDCAARADAISTDLQAALTLLSNSYCSEFPMEC